MIRIITDSASDVKKEERDNNQIDFVPMHVRIGNNDYLDGITLSGEEFFKKLVESNDLPKTSQVSPFEFEEKFKQYKDDEIICITMSRKLSGTYQSAVLASEEFDNVSVIDSENVTVGEKILVDLALKLIKENKTRKEIEKILNKEKKRIRLVALLGTLEYLKKGGRISAFTAVIGTFLNIKPVIEIKDGEVKVLGKAKGSKMGNNKLREKIKEYGDIDFNMPYAFAYSGFSTSLLEKYIQDSTDLCALDTKFDIRLIGSTIGTHIGPDAIAVAFYSNDSKDKN